MEVTQTPNGWAVADAAGNVLLTCQTNAEAWRWLDRHTREPINTHEDFADYLWSKDGSRNL